MRALTLFLLGCLFAFSALAEETTVYKRVRPDGTIEFGDTQVPGSEKVEVPSLPSYYNAPELPPSAPAAKKQEAPAPRYTQLQISEPAAESTLFFDENGVPVSVAINPPLEKNHSVVIFLDGKRAASGNATRFTLKEVYRGSHTVSAAIEVSGKTLLKSAPVTFYMIQHTKP